MRRTIDQDTTSARANARPEPGEETTRPDARQGVAMSAHTDLPPFVGLLSRADLPAMRAHLLRLDAADRVQRFAQPAEDAVIERYLERLDFGRDAFYGVHATVDGERRLIGLTQLAVEPGGRIAEIGVSVDADRRRQGVAGRMLARAVLHARNLGVAEVVMYFLPYNTELIELARALGMKLGVGDGQGIARLAPAAPDAASFACEMVENWAPRRNAACAAGRRARWRRARAWRMHCAATPPRRRRAAISLPEPRPVRRPFGAGAYSSASALIFLAYSLNSLIAALAASVAAWITACWSAMYFFMQSPYSLFFLLKTFCWLSLAIRPGCSGRCSRAWPVRRLRRCRPAAGRRRGGRCVPWCVLSGEEAASVAIC
ncbi:GNAT family N-acetyltransferase [Chitinimonas koreensis]|nr:GNAT family N-acetyltransferase [Chitinimonas koreensis]